MGRHYTDHETKHVSRYFFVFFLFVAVLFFAFWAMGMSGPVKLQGKIIDQNFDVKSVPAIDARAFVTVVALSADSMPFVGALHKEKTTTAEFQVGADGRFEFTADQWRIVRIEIRFESETASIEPAQWTPNSGIKYLINRQQYGSSETPWYFRANQKPKPAQPQTPTAEQDSPVADEQVADELAADEAPRDSYTQEILALLKKIQEKTGKAPFNSYNYPVEDIATVAIYRDISCEYDEQQYRLESAYTRFMDFVRKEGIFRKERKKMGYAIEHIDEFLESAKAITSDDAFAFKPLITELLKYYAIIKGVDGWEDKFMQLKDIPLQQGKSFYKAGFPKSEHSCNTMSDLTFLPENGIHASDILWYMFQNSEQWIYSFWARRYYEGNMEETHSLLTILERIASDKFYTVHKDKTVMSLILPKRIEWNMWAPRLSASDEEKKFASTYDDLNFVSVPEKGEFVFEGTHKGQVSAGSGVYLYTREGMCTATLSEVGLSSDVSGGDGLMTMRYKVKLDDQSSCRGKSAMVSFSKVDDKVIGSRLFTVALTPEENRRIRTALTHQHPVLEKMHISLVAYANRSGKSFYMLSVGGKSQAIFSIEAERINWIASAMGHYGDEVNSVPVADVNGNGLPEVIYSNHGRYSSTDAVVELGTGLFVKTLSAYGD